jgi:capsular polysaccharide biosynthesis protein
VDLIELRRALRRHLRASVVVAILVLCVGLVTIGHPAQTYDASSTVLVTPRTERFQQASETVLRVILPNVVVVVQSRSLHTAAAPLVPAAYTQTPISVTAAYDAEATALTVTANSQDANAAIAWSGALSHALVDRMKTDPYLDVQLLDPADGAGVSGRKARLLSFAAVFVLALFSFLLVAFGAQRLEEVRDTAGALRRRGVRVLGTVGTARRHQRKAQQVATVVAVLLQDDYESDRVVVTAQHDPSLVDWVTQLLQQGVDDLAEGRVGSAEPGVGRVSVVAGPLLDQLCLRAHLDNDYPPCVLAIDARTTSIHDVVTAVKTIEHAGIPCRGVVLVNDSHRIRRRSSRVPALVA